MLILRLVKRIIHSIRPFELRKGQQINTTTISGNGDDRLFDNIHKYIDIQSKKSRILRSKYWKNVYKRLHRYSQYFSSSFSSKNLE
jgi:hypothetical protein